MTEVPISSDVLQWARDFRRLSEEEAATKLGVTIEYLRALESGGETPSLTMFEKIAAQYQLPQSTLFRRTRRKNPPEPADYRTLGGERPNKTFELSVAISRARTLLTQLQRVSEDEAEYREPLLPHLRIAGDNPSVRALGRLAEALSIEAMTLLDPTSIYVPGASSLARRTRSRSFVPTSA